MVRRILCTPDLIFDNGMTYGAVIMAGHQLLLLKSLEHKPFEKFPEAGLYKRFVAQSVRQGVTEKSSSPSKKREFIFGLNSSPPPQPPWPVLVK